MGKCHSVRSACLFGGVLYFMKQKMYCIYRIVVGTSTVVRYTEEVAIGKGSIIGGSTVFIVYRARPSSFALAMHAREKGLAKVTID